MATLGIKIDPELAGTVHVIKHDFGTTDLVVQVWQGGFSTGQGVHADGEDTISLVVPYGDPVTVVIMGDKKPKTRKKVSNGKS